MEQELQSKLFAFLIVVMTSTVQHVFVVLEVTTVSIPVGEENMDHIQNAIIIEHARIPNYCMIIL